AKAALSDVNRQFRTLELRLQNLERHVTSDNYDLKSQINNL
ncbi:envelope stress response membrane protein PspC, partial [Shewanella sp.]|nr:envelope stress response membrane protein PspC [Shewanella sp.]